MCNLNITWLLFASRSAIRTYYYLVESKRENGKVKQKVLKYLGTNPNKISVDLTVEQCTAILGSAILRHGRRLKGNKDVEELIQKEGVGLLLLLRRFLMGPTVNGCYSWSLYGMSEVLYNGLKNKT